MKEKILEALGGSFKYDPSVQKKFQDAFNVRFDRKAELFNQFENFFASNKGIDELLKGKLFTEELKRLNLMALKARLAFITESKMPETVVISYMRLLIKEIENSSLCDGNKTVDLELSEEKMFKHLLDVAVFNEDLTELEGISNINLRLVLQTWVLHPEYLRHPNQLAELLACFSLISFKI